MNYNNNIDEFINLKIFKISQIQLIVGYLDQTNNPLGTTFEKY